MGSKGPNISSVIIAASSGGSTRIVGSTNLHGGYHKHVISS